MTTTETTSASSQMAAFAARLNAAMDIIRGIADELKIPLPVGGAAQGHAARPAAEQAQGAAERPASEQALAPRLAALEAEYQALKAKAIQPAPLETLPRPDPLRRPFFDEEYGMRGRRNFEAEAEKRAEAEAEKRAMAEAERARTEAEKAAAVQAAVQAAKQKALLQQIAGDTREARMTASFSRLASPPPHVPGQSEPAAGARGKNDPPSMADIEKLISKRIRELGEHSSDKSGEDEGWQKADGGRRRGRRGGRNRSRGGDAPSAPPPSGKHDGGNRGDKGNRGGSARVGAPPPAPAPAADAGAGGKGSDGRNQRSSSPPDGAVSNAGRKAALLAKLRSNGQRQSSVQQKLKGGNLGVAERARLQRQLQDLKGGQASLNQRYSAFQRRSTGGKAGAPAAPQEKQEKPAPDAARGAAAAAAAAPSQHAKRGPKKVAFETPAGKEAAKAFEKIKPNFVQRAKGLVPATVLKGVHRSLLHHLPGRVLVDADGDNLWCMVNSLGSILYNGKPNESQSAALQIMAEETLSRISKIMARSEPAANALRESAGFERHEVAFEMNFFTGGQGGYEMGMMALNALIAAIPCPVALDVYAVDKGKTEPSIRHTLTNALARDIIDRKGPKESIATPAIAWIPNPRHYMPYVAYEADGTPKPALPPGALITEDLLLDALAGMEAIASTAEETATAAAIAAGNQAPASPSREQRIRELAEKKRRDAAAAAAAKAAAEEAALDKAAAEAAAATAAAKAAAEAAAAKAAADAAAAKAAADAAAAKAAADAAAAKAAADATAAKAAADAATAAGLAGGVAAGAADLLAGAAAPGAPNAQGAEQQLVVLQLAGQQPAQQAEAAAAAAAAGQPPLQPPTFAPAAAGGAGGGASIPPPPQQQQQRQQQPPDVQFVDASQGQQGAPPGKRRAVRNGAGQ